MVRLPVVPENYLDSDQPSDQESFAPPDGGGGGTVVGPKNPIGPVQGYPEDGKHAWRAANDDTIVEAARKYNEAGRYLPGDTEYITPKLMKSRMMRESGGNPDAFKTDPFQVNKPRDWDAAKARPELGGLSEGQAMKPQTSADAALKWLHDKGRIVPEDHNRRGPYLGHYHALKNYNAARSPDGGKPGSEYANDVFSRAWASYGDWQQ